MGVHKSFTASFASGWVRIIKVITIKIFLAFVHEEDAGQDKCVPDRDVWLTLMKYG